MKLIFCPACHSIITLRLKEVSFCACAGCGGYYVDITYAVISQEAIPLGFDNRSFAKAIRKRPMRGDGFVFDAFSIPEECPTVVRLDRTGNPVLVDVHYINHDYLVGLLFDSMVLSYQLHRTTKDYIRPIGNSPIHLGSDTKGTDNQT